MNDNINKFEFTKKDVGEFCKMLCMKRSEIYTELSIGNDTPTNRVLLNQLSWTIGNLKQLRKVMFEFNMR